MNFMPLDSFPSWNSSTYCDQYYQYGRRANFRGENNTRTYH